MYQNKLDILEEQLANGEITQEQYDWELYRLEEELLEEEN